MRLLREKLILALVLTAVNVAMSSAQNGKDWWLPLFNEGLDLIEQKQYEAARQQFKKILQQNKKVAQAYYGLGLSYAAEKPDSRDALDQFEKATNLDKDYAEAYYQAALVYIQMNRFQNARDILYTATRRDPSFADAWLTLGEVEGEYGEGSKAVEAYIEAYKSIPDNEKLYDRLISSSIKYHEETKVIGFLEELAETSDSQEWRSDIAYLYSIAGDVDRSMSIVSAIPPDKANVRVFLLQAGFSFNNGNNTAGLAYYWSAVNSIKSEADAAAFFRDCMYIMRPEEYSRLQKTPLSEVWKFYYGFWRARDPNLSTDENERIAEHYVRLSYARKWYRRTSRGDDRRYKLEHPLREQFQPKVGSEVFGPYLPEFLQKNRDLDDMGLIYVRHGEPNLTATDLDPELPQNQSWLFYETWNHPELTFHFTKWSGSFGWILSSLPITFKGRADLGAMYERLDPENPGYQDLTYSDFVLSYENIDQECQRYAQLAIQRETSDYRYSEVEPLDFALHFVTFRGENENLLLEVYYGLSGQDTFLKSTTEGTFLALNEFFGFYDEHWNEADKLKKENQIYVGLTPEQWQQASIVDVQRFQVKPGKHHFEIQIEDQTSGKKGIYKGEYQFKDLWARDSLLVSDVILSGPIAPAKSSGKFVKQDVRYSPHMFSDFRLGQDIGLYFEIYNLSYDNEGQTNFRITSILRPLGVGAGGSKSIIGFFGSLFDREKEVVSTSLDYSGQTQNEKIYMNFDLREHNAGHYELVVEVEDLQVQKKARKTVEVKIKG